jgi:hypothetical protein
MHHAVDELRDENAVVERVREDVSPRYRAATWHPQKLPKTARVLKKQQTASRLAGPAGSADVV